MAYQNSEHNTIVLIFFFSFVRCFRLSLLTLLLDSVFCRFVVWQLERHSERMAYGEETDRENIQSCACQYTIPITNLDGIFMRAMTTRDIILSSARARIDSRTVGRVQKRAR